MQEVWPTVCRRNRKATTHPNERSPVRHMNKKAGETGDLPLQPTRPFSRGPGGDGNRHRDDTTCRRHRESYWIFELATLAPSGINIDD